jgi:hypothetical protein
VKRERLDPQESLFARVFELAERHQRQQQRAAAKAQGDTEAETSTAPQAMTAAAREAAENARLRALLEAQWQERQSIVATLATQRPTLLDIHEGFWANGSSENTSTYTNASDDQQQAQHVTRKRHGKRAP